MTTETVVLERDGRGPLEFSGELIANVSTQQDGKRRWTEIDLWMVESESCLWVVRAIGRSTVPGEVDRVTVTPCATVEELVAAVSKQGELTKPGWALIEKGKEEDELLFEYFHNVMRKAERL